MLKDDFYKITDLEISDDKCIIHAKIELNRSHGIFKGHFPEIPVVPGVCTVQMIKEIVIDAVKKDIMLVQGHNIKLNNPVNPDFHLSLNVDIALHQEMEVVHTNAEVYYDKVKFCSFRGDFKILQYSK